jgi:hypothetical protein
MGSFAHTVVTFGSVLLNRKRTITSLATAALLRRSAHGRAGLSEEELPLQAPSRTFRSSSKLPYEQHSRPLPSSRQRVRAVYLTGILEAASLGRIRFRLSNRASKYFEFLDVMMMGRPFSRELRPPKKERSSDQRPPPHPGNRCDRRRCVAGHRSQVLNDRADVSAATRARVQRLLVQYQYVPPRRPMVSQFGGGAG